MVNKLNMKIVDGPWSLIGTKNVIINSKNDALYDGVTIKIIKGERSVIGTIYKIERNNKNSLESDKYLRDQIKAKIGDSVVIEIIPEVPEAEEVIISPISENDDDYNEKIIRPFIETKVLSKGTKERIMAEGLTLYIIDTKPQGSVKITDKTEIIIRSSNDPDIRTMIGGPVTSSQKIKKELSELPEITFKDIGGLDNIKKFLIENIVMPLKDPSLFNKVGYKPIKSILLYGPPGTGKTVLATATAKEAGTNFIFMSASSFKNKYYGESERILRDTFENAKKNAPCILFIDEIDAIGQAREGDVGHITIINQLLTLMDQIAESNIFVIGCTNLLSSLDEALIRPGRMFKIEVPLPNEAEREFIFRIYLKDLNIPDKEIKQLVFSSKDYSGARIREVCNFAKLIALRETNFSNQTTITAEHVKKAMIQIDNRHSRGFMESYGKERDDIYDVS